MDFLATSLIDWSRLQFALTACYHWIFVPLTLGLAVIMSIMETAYVRTGKEEWKETAKFWQKLFGINFAFGVATGLVLEFQFGTNWSNYSRFVGDIFGAPLAIEAVLAFFLEATFISIMFFGWNKVGKKTHCASTWLVTFGATISALWILIANGWMQDPVGMTFNPDTVRNEMTDFWAVALSPTAWNKFTHSVLSGWVLGGVFVTAISAWYLLRKRNVSFALKSIKIGSLFGLAASLLIIVTGHTSAMNIAEKQPMKLAAMEGLYTGGNGVELVGVGFLNPDKEHWQDDVQPVVGKIAIPKMLSFLSFMDFNAFVPGIRDIIEGGYVKPNGEIAPSFHERQQNGLAAINALAEYHKASGAGDTAAMAEHKAVLEANYYDFGYGYLQQPEDSIPPVGLTFYSFHLMVIFGMLLIVLFAVVVIWIYRNKISDARWLLWLSILAVIPGYLAGQFGWIVAEVGRQPWTIQDVLPVQAAVSSVSVESVKTTFFIFLTLFTILFIAEVRIMLRAIRKGPDEPGGQPKDKENITASGTGAS